MASGIAAKRLELLKEVVPKISRVLVLSYRVDPISAPQLEELESAAASLGVKLLIQDIQSADDIPAAFGALGLTIPSSMIILADELIRIGSNLLQCRWSESGTSRSRPARRRA
jgi:putative ABC transport system substrate-binding protein